MISIVMSGYSVSSFASAGHKIVFDRMFDGGDTYGPLTLKTLSGRGASYRAPPPQIPPCSFPAVGSRRRSNAIEGKGLGSPHTSNPLARRFSDTPGPALRPGRASLL